MRTKTLLLSTLLGALGSVAVHAQTNVYSLNAVGYINVTCPPGYSMISCPLIASPDNTIGTLLNNASGQYTGDSVFFYDKTTGLLNSDQAQAIGGRGTTNANGWANGGLQVLGGTTGVGCWFQNAGSNNITLTFVGTVPSGSLTNTLSPGFNLVGSVLPTSGDIVTNPLSTLTNYNVGDEVFVYANPGGFTIFQSGVGRNFSSGYNSNWASSDPIVPNVGEAFWYQNTGAAVNWVENYSVSQ